MHPQGLMKGVEGATFANNGTDWNAIPPWGQLHLHFFWQGGHSRRIFFIESMCWILPWLLQPKLGKKHANRYLGRTYIVGFTRNKWSVSTWRKWLDFGGATSQSFAAPLYPPGFMLQAPMRRLEHNSSNLLLSEWLIYGKWWRFLDHDDCISWFQAIQKPND